MGFIFGLDGVQRWLLLIKFVFVLEEGGDVLVSVVVVVSLPLYSPLKRYYIYLATCLCVIVTTYVYVLSIAV